MQAVSDAPTHVAMIEARNAAADAEEALAKKQVEALRFEAADRFVDVSGMRWGLSPAQRYRF